MAEGRHELHRFVLRHNLFDLYVSRLRGTSSSVCSSYVGTARTQTGAAQLAGQCGAYFKILLSVVDDLET